MRGELGRRTTRSRSWGVLKRSRHAAIRGPERPARYLPLKAGERLYAQTLQSFTYLEERLACGGLDLPDGARPLASFGREGKVIREGDVS